MRRSSPPAPTTSESEVFAHIKEDDEAFNNSRWSRVDTRLIYMLLAVAIAVTFLIIRSVYRTIELANGW